MVPRKKRIRYIQSAEYISKEYGIKCDFKNWNEVWELLDKYGEPTYVYAIVDLNNLAVKIGRSKTPGKRLNYLKTANASELKLWGFCVETEEFNERILHSMLSQHRVSREWFKLNTETNRQIQEMRRRAGV